ncbi:unnamed protein product, partial [Sphenostylis stenocarpa]
MRAKKTSYMKIKLQGTSIGIKQCPKIARKASQGPRTQKLDKTGRDHRPRVGTAVPTLLGQVRRASHMWDGRPTSCRYPSESVKMQIRTRWG